MALFERAFIKAVRADLLKRTLVCNVEIDLNDDTLAEAQRVRIMADSGEAVMVQIVPNDDQGRLWREDPPEQTHTLEDSTETFDMEVQLDGTETAHTTRVEDIGVPRPEWESWHGVRSA